MINRDELRTYSTPNLEFLLKLATDAGESGTEAAGFIATVLASRKAAADSKAAAVAEEKARMEADRLANTIAVGDYEVRIVTVSGKASKARVYFSRIETPELEAMEAALPRPLPIGEDKANDQAYATFNRAYVRHASAVAAQAVPALVEAGLIERLPMAYGGKYSRKAGCSTCPCSPGLVLNQMLFNKRGYRVNVFISRRKAA